MSPSAEAKLWLQRQPEYMNVTFNPQTNVILLIFDWLKYLCAFNNTTNTLLHLHSTSVNCIFTYIDFKNQWVVFILWLIDVYLHKMWFKTQFGVVADSYPQFTNCHDCSAIRYLYVMHSFQCILVSSDSLVYKKCQNLVAKSLILL